jgi:hypothetical protein
VTAGLADWLTGWLAAGWLAADKFVPGVLIQRMNSLNSMATNSLLSLSPEQRAMLVAAATEAVPEGGLLRTLWRAALAPRRWWRVRNSSQPFNLASALAGYIGTRE